MKKTRLVNCIGFDDCPFERDFKGDVEIVGTVWADLRLDGILMGKVRKDGINSTERIASLVKGSKFFQHAGLIMLQGIALAGFNVIDAWRLHSLLDMPVLIVSRRQPDMKAIKKALFTRIPGGRKKWDLIKKMGPMEKCHGCFVQRAGLDFEEALAVVERFSIYGNIPEPLRIAHLIAGAMVYGTSTGRV
ncbi:MAG: DUF99 domain-containing protein [Thermodesulfatator sp.]|nr:MAG: DUF99 domain-containing protein [Thermodesulfatator sp.]